MCPTAMHDRPFYTPKLSCATFLHSFFRTRIFASGDFFCGFFYSLYIYLLPALRGPEIRCGLYISELTAIVAKLQSKYGALVAWCIVAVVHMMQGFEPGTAKYQFGALL
jgi:hypothetical protein